MKAKKIAYYAVLVALAMIVSYVEVLIPINFGIPGIKLGLANIVVLVGLYLLGAKASFSISMVRIILSAFMFSGLGAMMYSLAGGILSFLLMYLAKRINKFSIIGVSIVGGISHNIGQIAIASLVVSSIKIMYYLPVLIIAGLITGLLIGILGKVIINHLKKIDLF